MNKRGNESNVKEAFKAGDVQWRELIPEYGSMSITKSQNHQHISGRENKNVFYCN